jgi:hypothetical protein
MKGAIKLINVIFPPPEVILTKQEKEAADTLRKVSEAEEKERVERRERRAKQAEYIDAH